MISIRKASDQLDRLAEMADLAKSSYLHALQSTAEYAVEFSAGEANAFRQHLDRIRADAEKAASSDDWRSVRASFRGELRERRDQSLAHLTRMRAEVKAAFDVMQVFADSVAENGADHRQDLQAALQTLDSAARTARLEDLRAVVVQTGVAIGTSIERMERAHALVLALLRDEILVLHRRIEAEQQAHFMDAATGVWNRHKIEEFLEERLRTAEGFCVVVVCARNLKRLGQQYASGLLESSIKALAQRFAAVAGREAIVGRWDEETFAAILAVEPAEAIQLSREAARRLAGTYSAQEDGVSRSIELQVAAGVIDRAPNGDAADFRRKLPQITAALLASGAP